jgi:two-component system CheB/CheR fusion protein
MSKVAELCRAHALEPFATKRVTKGGATVDVSIVVTALVDEAGEVYAIATTERAREPAPR